MKKHYVSLETAKTLKEKGYEELCIAYYNTLPSLYKKGIPNWKLAHNEAAWSYNRCANNPHIIDAPELHEVQQWLREEHSVEVVIGIDSDFNWRGDDEDLTGESIAKVMYYTYDVCVCNRWLITNTIYSDDKKYATYEDALESGINEALKMI